MTLGIARPVVSPTPSLPVRPADPRVGGEDPARIRATIARAPLFAALPITAIEDLTALVRDKLAAAEIPAATLSGYVTPRRMTVIAHGIPERQP